MPSTSTIYSQSPCLCVIQGKKPCHSHGAGRRKYALCHAKQLFFHCEHTKHFTSSMKIHTHTHTCTSTHTYIRILKWRQHIFMQSAQTDHIYSSESRRGFRTARNYISARDRAQEGHDYRPPAVHRGEQLGHACCCHTQACSAYVVTYIQLFPDHGLQHFTITLTLYSNACLLI
jgi:hypothetical protein